MTITLQAESAHVPFQSSPLRFAPPTLNPPVVPLPPPCSVYALCPRSLRRRRKVLPSILEPLLALLVILLNHLPLAPSRTARRDGASVPQPRTHALRPLSAGERPASRCRVGSGVACSMIPPGKDQRHRRVLALFDRAGSRTHHGLYLLHQAFRPLDAAGMGLAAAVAGRRARFTIRRRYIFEDGRGGTRVTHTG